MVMEGAMLRPLGRTGKGELVVGPVAIIRRDSVTRGVRPDNPPAEWRV
jgi:hypothetical protein